MRRRWLGFGVALILLAGCAGGPEEDPEEGGEAAEVGEETETEGEAAEVETLEEDGEIPVPRGIKMEDVFLGEVNYVSGPAGFALIQVVASKKVEPGENLTSRSVDGRDTGEMILSPERKRWYLIGDVISGYPQVGDRIYYQVPVTPGPTATEEENRDQRRGSKKKGPGTGWFRGR